MTDPQNTLTNGVDVGKLLATLDAIKANSELANFQFRAETEWKSGGHSRTRIQSFHGAGAEDASRGKPFAMEADEPPVLLGGNAGPNAVEIVLAGLASCLAVGFAYNAAARGIRIEGLTLNVAGNIDLYGFLGLSGKIRPGYRDIRMTCRVKSDTTREQLMELCEYVQKTSPRSGHRPQSHRRFRRARNMNRSVTTVACSRANPSLIYLNSLFHT